MDLHRIMHETDIPIRPQQQRARGGDLHRSVSSLSALSLLSPASNEHLFEYKFPQQSTRYYGEPSEKDPVPANYRLSETGLTPAAHGWSISSGSAGPVRSSHPTPSLNTLPPLLLRSLSEASGASSASASSPETPATDSYFQRHHHPADHAITPADNADVLHLSAHNPTSTLPYKNTLPALQPARDYARPSSPKSIANMDYPMGPPVQHSFTSPSDFTSTSPFSARAQSQRQQQFYPQNPLQPSFAPTSPPSIARTPLSQSDRPTPVSRPSTSSGSRTGGRKTSYPCPVARDYTCTEYFTTSGHAARHAKKHTGKKDAICPECNKAFTRKDNMEQHRRTHMPGRSAPKTNTNISTEQSRHQRKRAKLAHQQHSSSSSIESRRRHESVSSSANDMPMPSNIISPQPHVADHGVLSPLDPTAISPAMSSYDAMSPSMYWQPTASFPASAAIMTASVGNTEMRPRLYRSSYGDSVSHLLPQTMRSPSASSGGGSPDSSGLDMLANAADHASNRA